MNRRKIQACLLAAFACGLPLISGCASPPVAGPQRHPVELTAVAEREIFPLQASMYARNRVFIYGPEHRNYSVGYQRESGDFDHSVVFFVYDTGASLRNQFRAEKAGILQAHSGAALLHESGEKLTHENEVFKGLRADYVYEEILGGQIRAVHSALLLIESDGRFLKLRSTSPVANRKAADAGTAALLDSVDWAVCLLPGRGSSVCSGRK